MDLHNKALDQLSGISCLHPRRLFYLWIVALVWTVWWEWLLWMSSMLYIGGSRGALLFWALPVLPLLIFTWRWCSQRIDRPPHTMFWIIFIVWLVLLAMPFPLPYMHVEGRLETPGSNSRQADIIVPWGTHLMVAALSIFPLLVVTVMMREVYRVSRPSETK
jgi:hypothetical protein